MSRPRLLDLFCGAGGAAMGYHRAGFDVVGVDIKPQPHYPFEFRQADALEYLEAILEPVPVWQGVFDAVHASPPCQAFSALNRAVGNQDIHENLIPETRERLQATGLPYVIENVPGAPLIDPILICGAAMGLEVVRHRIFECSFPILTPGCAHRPGGAADGTYVMFGRRSPRAQGRRIPVRASEQEWRAMAGVDWMTIKESRQAIPPAYTEHIGRFLIEHIEREAA